MLEKISQDINEALKRGDKATAEALRLLKSALMYAKIAAGHDLDNDEAAKVIRKEIKSRIEARDMYAANNRAQQAAKEEFECSVYTQYVPKQLGEAEINAIIVDVSKTVSENTFSQLMPAVMKIAAGRADGKMVSECVKKYIEGE